MGNQNESQLSSQREILMPKRYESNLLINKTTAPQDLSNLITLSYTETQAYPYNCIGIFYFKDKNKVEHFSTAFLIAPNLVVTLASSIYSHSMKELYSDHIFYPKMCGQRKQYYSPHANPLAFMTPSSIYEDSSSNFGCHVKEIKINKNYVTNINNRYRYDYALLKLQSSVQREKYLHLGVGFNTPQQPLSMFGYNSLKSDFQQGYQIGIKKANVGTIIEEEQSRRLIHSMPVAGGSSGSPIFIDRGYQFYIFAMHRGSNQKTGSNVALIFTEEMIENINNWASELSSPPITAKQLNQIFEWNATTYSENYKIHASAVERIGFQGPSYQLVSKYPLAQDSTTSLLFIIQSYGKKNSDICVGLLTEDRKNEKWSGDFQDSVGYWSSIYDNKSGVIKIDGNIVQKADKELFVEETGSVQMNVDFQKMTIQFINHSRPNKPKWQFALPSYYRNKENYFFVVTNRVGSKISFFS